MIEVAPSIGDKSGGGEFGGKATKRLSLPERERKYQSSFYLLRTLYNLPHEIISWQSLVLPHEK